MGYHCRFGIPGFFILLALSAVGACTATPRESVKDSIAEERVLLDCYFNNEWKKNAEGVRVRYHYVWDDSADSGYSQLSVIIRGLGAAVDTLADAPTLPALQKARVYFIVDPDTPEETEHPHYIDQQAIEAITRWVHDGGILLLFGNDKGKAEFVHLNQLAERFGIQFNEDSRNRVTGREFQIGTFDVFPDHPLFKGVRKIFIKELSTLRVQEPAHAVLSEHGDIIMAYTRIGRGCVFAVGDPWFYNEYMDQRRLPEGYDNAKAAENLFRWLLQQTPQR